ncbi:hypothetical protein ACFL47_08175 [Candidatus Latescibacterota bacterium]
MTTDTQQSHHRGFIRTSGVFIGLSLVSTVFEVGFLWMLGQLPTGDYGTYIGLFNVFFIITVPLLSVQLLISKEISSLYATDNAGQAGIFIRNSLYFVVLVGLVIVLTGLAGSPLIAKLLNIDSVLPVILLLVIILVYTPIPVFFGTIQGIKRFYTLGIISILWGFFRFIFGLGTIMTGLRVNGMLAGNIMAVLITLTVSAFLVRNMFSFSSGRFDLKETFHTYKFVLPIVATLFFVTELRQIDLVIANKFFNMAQIDAYACASLVGKGFFAITGIIMVMFPLVSEEKSRKRNPFIFLGKSFAVIAGLSSVGIALAWFAPGFVMKAITLNREIPGAEQLIQIMGIVMFPISVIYIMSNYFLAQHKAGFIPILLTGMILQMLAIIFFHDTPYQMLSKVGMANYAILLFMIIYLISDQLKYRNTT